MAKKDDGKSVEQYISDKLSLRCGELEYYDDLIISAITNQQINKNGLQHDLHIAKAELEARFLTEVTTRIAITPMAVAYAERLYQVAVTLDSYYGRDNTENLAMLMCALSFHNDTADLLKPAESTHVDSPKQYDVSDWDEDLFGFDPPNNDANLHFEQLEGEQMEFEDDMPF